MNQMKVLICLVLTALAFASPAYAENNRGDQENGLRNEFSNQGGHVIWTSEESVEPGGATSLAAAFVPDIIRWALEHKGVNIASGDVVVGHKTINNWRKVGNRYTGYTKVPLPNTYFGYAGWKP